MASLVQDLWLGGPVRLRGRRLAPYDDPQARVVFQPDLGMTLEEPLLASFLEALGARVEVVAFEPRGQGGSAGRFGPEALEDLQALIASAPRRWPDGRALIVAGHGVGGALALAAAAEGGVEGAVALAPYLPEALATIDLARRLRGLSVPTLVVAPRAATDRAILDALESHPGAALLSLPGDLLAPLRAPWVDIVAAWASDRGQAP